MDMKLQDMVIAACDIDRLALAAAEAGKIRRLLRTPSEDCQ